MRSKWAWLFDDLSNHATIQGMSSDSHFPAHPSPDLDLGVVILSYNTRELLRACLHSILDGHERIAYALCVVDNASQDGSAEMVAAEFPQMHLIRNDSNPGYSAGNNLGLRWFGFGHKAVAQEDPVTPRYALLLNPDTLLPPGTLTQMTEFLDGHPQAGVAGPRVRRPDGSLDKACRRSFPTPQISFYRMIGLARLFPNHPRFNAYNLGHLPEDGVYPVDAVVGAYMQVRREAMEDVGLLDEEFYMYGEDLDWAKRIQDAGWEVWYNGQAQITHVKEAASQYSGRSRVAFYEAMWIFYRKHYRAQTNWFLDKAILVGIGVKGGLGVARHLWRIYASR